MLTSTRRNPPQKAVTSMLAYLPFHSKKLAHGGTTTAVASPAPKINTQQNKTKQKTNRLLSHKNNGETIRFN